MLCICAGICDTAFAMKNTTRKSNPKPKRAPEVIQLHVLFGEKNTVFTTMTNSKQLADPTVLKAAVKLRFPSWTQITADYPDGRTEILTNRRAKK